jgi:hypothetical protein
LVNSHHTITRSSYVNFPYNQTPNYQRAYMCRYNTIKEANIFQEWTADFFIYGPDVTIHKRSKYNIVNILCKKLANGDNLYDFI